MNPTLSHITGLAALSFGCASSLAPVELLSRASSAVARAEQSPAVLADVRASEHLATAQNDLRVAKKSLAAGDSQAASLLLLRAEADGRAAVACGELHQAEVSR